MLALLDLRERGGRLEPTKLEIDPATAETVRQILQRVFVEGDEVLIELAVKFDGVDLSGCGVLVSEDEFAAADADTPPELRRALDELIERLRLLAERQIPTWAGRCARAVVELGNELRFPTLTGPPPFSTNRLAKHTPSRGTPPVQ